MTRSFSFALLLVSAAAALAAGPEELAGVRTVYLIPMRNGFDHFLVNHLTRNGVYQVVTDPKKADAVFTDRIGATFEKQLEEWRAPTPTPATEAKKDEGKKDAEVVKPESPAATQGAVRPPSSFTGGGRGTLFLISRKSGDVLWSGYERPKNFGPDELDKTAERFVKQLQKDLTGAK